MPLQQLKLFLPTAEKCHQLFSSCLQLSLPFDCHAPLCHTCERLCCTVLTYEPTEVSLFHSKIFHLFLSKYTCKCAPLSWPLTLPYKTETEIKVSIDSCMPLHSCVQEPFLQLLDVLKTSYVKRVQEAF